MVQDHGEHAPAHPLTELDHPGRESMTGLRKGLDNTPRRVVPLRDGRKGHFVAEIPKLERRICPAIDPDQLCVRGVVF